MYGAMSRMYTFKPRTSDIDPDMKAFLENLHKIYSYYKKNEVFYGTLHKGFDSSENPYRFALYVMTNCTDFQLSKTGLAFAVLDTFFSWLKDNTNAISCLNDGVKEEASKHLFSITCSQLSTLLIKVYELDGYKDQILEIIRSELQNKRFKEACYLSTALKLHDHFTIEDFIIQLILQDRTSIAEEFLTGSKKHQKETLYLLDSLLAEQCVDVSINSLASRLKVDEVKWEKLQMKPLKKLVTRLSKKFNLTTECPNLIRKQQNGALQYLIHKRYVDKSIGLESWQELIMDAVQYDSSLHMELVISCAQYGAVEESAYWAFKYEVPHDKLPYSVLEYINSNQCSSFDRFPSVDDKYEDDDPWGLPSSSSAKMYYRLPIAESNVIMVDNIDSYNTFIHQSLKGQKLAAIDCEWKPYFGTTSTELALLQIAIDQQVFLIDTIKLKTILNYIQWDQLAFEFFYNNDILKLGFGISNDLKAIEKALPLGTINMETGFYIDLYKLWQKLAYHFNFKFPYYYEENDPLSGEGLTNLVYLCFGKYLNKDDQFSNWERRPLRESQRMYAATDAYCLLDIYYEMKHNCELQAIDFHQACFSGTKYSKYGKQKEKIKKDPPPVMVLECSSARPVIKAQDTRVVCDTMVQGLGKRLRQLGIDTYILSSGENHTQCVRIAQRENRFIITRGSIFEQLEKEVPEGFILKVKCDSLEEQVIEVIKYFNIKVTSEDVFSRCQHCNSNEFKLMNNAEIRNKRTVTKYGIRVYTYNIPPRVFYNVNKYYVCERCGRCYWEGSHLQKFLQQSIFIAATSVKN